MIVNKEGDLITIALLQQIEKISSHKNVSRILNNIPHQINRIL